MPMTRMRRKKSEALEKEHIFAALKRVARIAKTPLVAQSATAALSIGELGLKDTETLETDIRSAVSLLKDSNQQAELAEFKKALMYVATSVARAYREEMDHHEEEFIMQTFITKISGYLNGTQDPAEYKNMNISPAEDTALIHISEALQ